MNIALSLLVLTAVALILGAILLFRRGGYRKQASLMLILAFVMAVNVGIWSLPTPEGKSLSKGAQTKQAAE